MAKNQARARRVPDQLNRDVAWRWVICGSRPTDISTKFAVRLTEDGKSVRIDGHADAVAAACKASLRRLGVEAIDLYYAHRLDPSVPIEETIRPMFRLVE